MSSATVKQRGQDVVDDDLEELVQMRHRSAPLVHALAEVNHDQHGSVGAGQQPEFEEGADDECRDCAPAVRAAGPEAKPDAGDIQDEERNHKEELGVFITPGRRRGVPACNIIILCRSIGNAVLHLHGVGAPDLSCPRLLPAAGAFLHCGSSARDGGDIQPALADNAQHNRLIEQPVGVILIVLADRRATSLHRSRCATWRSGCWPPP